MRKGKQRLLVIAFTICFILLALDFAILYSAMDLDFYVKQFEINDTLGKTGMALEELTAIFKGVLDYMWGLTSDMQYIAVDKYGFEYEVFSYLELTHMVDVRNLFTFAKILFVVLALLCLIFMTLMIVKRKKFTIKVGKVGKTTMLIILGLMIGVVVASIIDFRSAVIIFHKIFFRNNYWVLPSYSMLIKMLPEVLFARIAIKIVLIFTSFFIVLLLVYILISKIEKKKNVEEPFNISFE